LWTGRSRCAAQLTRRDLAYQTFFDQLLRVLLEFKSQPAVVILGAWSPQVALDLGYADPQIIHTPIAQCVEPCLSSRVMSAKDRFRDVPYVSMKRLVFNTFLRFPQSIVKSFFQPDMLHPNARGHVRAIRETLARLTRSGY